jgi:hypothetical protein
MQLNTRIDIHTLFTPLTLRDRSIIARKDKGAGLSSMILAMRVLCDFLAIIFLPHKFNIN